MADWYRPLDLVEGLNDTRIAETETADDVVHRILVDAANRQQYG
jgi:hypothetical protein